MLNITIIAENGINKFQKTCEQEDLKFEMQSNGDGVLILPDEHGTLSITINKENIS